MTGNTIFIVWQTMEKVSEQPVHLSFSVVYFTAVFEAFWRGELTTMLRCIGMDPKCTSLVWECWRCSLTVCWQTGSSWKWDCGKGVWYLLSRSVRSLCSSNFKNLCKEFKLDTNLYFEIRYADGTTIVSTVLEMLQISTEELQVVYSKWSTK